jgi:hypothetical protein
MHLLEKVYAHIKNCPRRSCGQSLFIKACQLKKKLLATSDYKI